MCRALVRTLAGHTQGLICTWPKCLSACSQPLGECTEHEVPVQEGHGQLGSYKQMLGRLCNMAADMVSAVPWMHVLQQGAQNFHLSQQQQGPVGTWQKRQWVSVSCCRRALASGNTGCCCRWACKANGVSEEQDVSGPIHFLSFDLRSTF